MKVKWFLLCVALLLLAFLFIPRGMAFTPPELVGTWRTQCPSHCDRFFRITESTVVFDQGDFEVDVFFVSNVEKTVRGSEILYEIEFHRQGEPESTLTLLFDPAPPERIAFEHRREIEWRRSDEKGGA